MKHQRRFILMTLAQNLAEIGILNILMKKTLNTLVLMPLLRKRVMLIAKCVGILHILFLLIFADMIVGILVISKTI